MLLELVQILYSFGPAYAADVAPILARPLLPRWKTPIDFGITLRGRPLLGTHKTWRGILAGVVGGGVTFRAQRWLYEAGFLTELAAFDFSAWEILPGLLMGFGAVAGDAVKSFFKRRAGIPPGASWPVLDQLDFYVGAHLCLWIVFVPPVLPTLLTVPIILVSDVAATAIFFRLGLKEEWP